MRIPFSLSQSIPLLLTGVLFLSPLSEAHEGTGFSDLPEDHPAFTAVEHLHSLNVIHGYPDGTFRPEAKVNRAEAVKILIAPLATKDALATFTESPFEDIPAGTWYLPYTEAARQGFGIVDGPPKRMKFEGERTVLKVEFLKMLLIAYGVDPFAFDEIRSPLANDVMNAEEWYYPYLRYSLSASLISPDARGNLSPGAELTREDVALILYRLLTYREGRRTQALLSAVERELLSTLDVLEDNDIDAAEQTSVRALLAARGAHARLPDDPIVRSALKITEAFRALVSAYRAGLNQEFDKVLEFTGIAWNLGEEARSISSDMETIALKVQESAHAMAESARALQNGE